jgi:protocatechuate 3,4-dioxygenase beta subunit
MDEAFNRRDVIRTVGGAGLAAVFGVRALQFLGEDAEAATTCLLTPETTEGPYWVDGALSRRDVTEGKPGVPLVIRFTVLNAKTCTLIRNADVEIWHCDAFGNYSAVNGATTRFLRGHQRSNALGKAEFLTVFPGWYPGRTPHVHMKVSVGGNEVHTGQVFFNEKVTTTVFKQAPYRSRGQYDTPHASDGIYTQAGGSRAELKLTRRTHGLRGYVGTIVIGVVPS